MPRDALGPYRLEAELGSGGMGSVHRAKALAGAAVPEGTTVAVKAIHPHLVGDAGFVRRFRREAEIGLHLRHENLVRTLDTGTSPGPLGDVHWLVLEYVEGRDLRALLEEGGPVPEGLVRHVGTEVARALAALHTAGVVHRDLKPENVLLAHDEVVKVTDLGVARPVDASGRLSETGAFVGSLQYAAPEQFRSTAAAPDPRTDLHALGLILYEMATGRHPYAAGDVAEALDRLREGRRRKPSDVNSRVTPFLEAVVETLLATSPGDRFSDAATVARVLAEGEASPWWTEHRSAVPRAATRAFRMPVDREITFTGREAELDRLLGLWKRTKDRHGTAVLVEGEEGVGKTRLLDAFAERLRVQGDDVDLLYGRHAAADPAGGFAAIAMALRTRLAPEDLEPALCALLPESVAVVPALAAHLGSGAAPAGAPPLTREALATLVLRALRALAERRPVLLVLDDLHRAPPDGLALFGALALGADGHRLLVAGTTAPGLQEETVVDLARRGVLERVPLGRFGPKDLLRLVAEAVGSVALAEELMARIAAASDGNPYFALEIVRDLERRGLLARRADGRRTPTATIRDLRVPPSVSELVRTRLARLDAEDRDLLDAAACAGAAFDPRLVAEALAQPVLPVLRRLARIEREHGLVRSEGASCHFDPPQVRDVVHEAMPEYLRRETHAALAEAIERAGGATPLQCEPAVLACEHRVAAGDPVRAAVHLEAALAHLDPRHEHRRAAGLERAVLDAPGTIAGEARLAALFRTAYHLNRLGESPEEGARLREAVALADTLGTSRAKARWRLAAHLGATGRTAEARVLLEESITLARASDDAVAEGSALGTLANLLTSTGDYPAARVLRERQIALARARGDIPEEMMALGGLGLIEIEVGHYDGAMEFLGQQLDQARRRGDLWSEAAAEGNLGIVFAALGRNEEALAHDTRQLEIDRAIGHRVGEGIATCNIAGALFELGRYEEARERFEHYLLLSRETGSRQDEAVAHVNLGAIETTLRDLESAKAHLAACLEITRAMGARRVEGYALQGMGEAEWAAGERAVAERSWREALEVRRSIGYRRGVADTLERLVECYLADGRIDEARAALDEVDAITADLDLPITKVTSAVHRAGLPGGDPSLARTLLRVLEPRLSLHGLDDAWERLAHYTGDPDDLAQSRAYHARFLARVPPSAQARFATT